MATLQGTTSLSAVIEDSKAMMSLVKQHKNVYRMITKVNGFTQANAKAARTELENTWPSNLGHKECLNECLIFVLAAGIRETDIVVPFKLVPLVLVRFGSRMGSLSSTGQSKKVAELLRDAVHESERQVSKAVWENSIIVDKHLLASIEAYQQYFEKVAERLQEKIVAAQNTVGRESVADSLERLSLPFSSSPDEDIARLQRRYAAHIHKLQKVRNRQKRRLKLQALVTELVHCKALVNGENNDSDEAEGNANEPLGVD